MKYLVYDSDYDHVIVVTQKPPSDYIGMTHPELGEGLIQVWHSQKVQLDTVRLAIFVLLHRSSTHRLREKGGNQSLIVRATIPFDQINSAVDQIESRYHPDDYALVAVGASPKIIKWILKRKGYETKAINVSNVKSGVTPTTAFEAYVKRKLQAILHQKIVIIDYVDSGEALSVIKDYVSSIWKEMGKGAVVAVALGAGPKYRSPYSDNIDYVVQNIPTLIAMLAEHQYKLLMGRKQGRDHATFPKPDLRPGREVTADQIQRYQLYKSTFARAVELGVFDITVDDFREIQDTESHHSDEDEDCEWTY